MPVSAPSEPPTPAAADASAPAGRASSRLDRPLARIAALAVFLLMAAALGYLHRDDLFPPEAAVPDPDDPVALCFADRARGIDAMLADGTIGAEQAALFKTRAEAMCQDQFGAGATPAPLQQ